MKMGAQMAAMSTEAATCKVDRVMGSTRSKACSPNTSDPASSKADSSDSTSPKPNPDNPPRPHSRYSPTTTRHWMGMCCQR